MTLLRTKAHLPFPRRRPDGTYLIVYSIVLDPQKIGPLALGELARATNPALSEAERKLATYEQVARGVASNLKTPAPNGAHQGERPGRMLDL